MSEMSKKAGAILLALVAAAVVLAGVGWLVGAAARYLGEASRSGRLEWSPVWLTVIPAAILVSVLVRRRRKRRLRGR